MTLSAEGDSVAVFATVVALLGVVLALDVVVFRWPMGSATTSMRVVCS